MISARAGSMGCGCNPFATRFVRPGALPYRFTAEDRPGTTAREYQRLVSQLKRHRLAVIVGPHGSGKSTLIQSLASILRDEFSDMVHLQLHAPAGGGVASRIGHTFSTASTVHRSQRLLARGGLLIVDGAEQLRSIDRLRLRRVARRRGQTLLATSHRRLRGMKTLHETFVSREMVCALTNHLLSDASPSLRLAIASQLDRQDWTKLTNVRDLWFDFYDVLQNCRREHTSLENNRQWPSDSPSS